MSMLSKLPGLPCTMNGEVSRSYPETEGPRIANKLVPFYPFRFLIDS